MAGGHLRDRRDRAEDAGGTASEVIQGGARPPGVVKNALGPHLAHGGDEGGTSPVSGKRKPHDERYETVEVDGIALVARHQRQKAAKLLRNTVNHRHYILGMFGSNG
ncbi:hypothetical protein GUI43_01047 [Micromonospora noduli]|uniref:Uncharacterized protein n=1 Tax=Micromonospora noduli TaxID=709876 RepID=A0ABX9D9H2_9ACTN|nr:hypothetical protein GUI43_01047 [Micromonospora noduli]RAO24670.1 hypothetical protein MED15_00428 [Micromonospora noduli]